MIATSSAAMDGSVLRGIRIGYMTTSSSSAIFLGCSLSKNWSPLRQASVRVFLTSVGFASRGKNGLSGHVKIIMVGHD